MADIVPLHRNAQTLLKVIREIVKDSRNVNLTQAFDKGFAGKVSMSQVWRCLEEGTLTNDPVMNEHGHYLCELNTVAAGQDIYLTIAVNMEIVTNKVIYVLHISEG